MNKMGMEPVPHSPTPSQVSTHVTNGAGEGVDNALVGGVHNTAAIDLNDLVTHTHTTSIGNGASC